MNKDCATSRSRKKTQLVIEKVQSVVNYLVETIAVDDQGKEVKDKKKATLGSNVRKKHTDVFKAKVIHGTNRAEIWNHSVTRLKMAEGQR